MGLRTFPNVRRIVDIARTAGAGADTDIRAVAMAADEIAQTVVFKPSNRLPCYSNLGRCVNQGALCCASATVPGTETWWI